MTAKDAKIINIINVVINVMPASRARLAIFLIVLYFALMVPVFGDLNLALSILTLALAGLLIWSSIVDFEAFRLPNLSSFSIAVMGLGAIASISPALIPAHLIAAAVGFAVLWGIGEVIFRIKGIEALGIGDAKLFGAGLLWVGPYGGPTVLLLGSLGAIFFVGMRFLSKKEVVTRQIPFGPFLGFAIFAVWLYGPLGI